MITLKLSKYDIYNAPSSADFCTYFRNEDESHGQETTENYGDGDERETCVLMRTDNQRHRRSDDTQHLENNYFNFILII